MIDNAGQGLQQDDGSEAEGNLDCEQTFFEADFPLAPRGSYNPPVDEKAFGQVDAHLVGSLLAKAVNISNN